VGAVVAVAGIPDGVIYWLIDPATPAVHIDVAVGGTFFGNTFFVANDSIEVSVSIPNHAEYNFGAVVAATISVVVTFPSEYGTELSPGYVIEGYSSDGTNIIIPIASLVGLTAAEADAITGDWREILQAILLKAVEHHRTYRWSLQPRTYNPFGMNLLNSRTFDRHFGITFYTDMGAPHIAPEP